MIKKIFTLLIFTFLFNINAYSQKKFIDEVNSTLDEYEMVIKQEKKKNAKLQARINKLIKDETINDNKLREAIQQWNFSNLTIQKQEDKLKKLQNKYELIENKNKFLELRLTEINVEISKIKSSEENYKIKLAERIKKEGKQKLFEEAIEKSNTDFESGKVKSTVNRFENKKALLSFSSGLKGVGLFDDFELDGPLFNLTFGYVINQEENIFLGIGVNYQYYFKEEEVLYGAFVTSKVALLDEELIGRYGTLYALLDIGYSFFENNANIKGGVFTNIGIGTPLSLSDNIKLDVSITWRRLNGSIKENDIYKDEVFNSIDLRFGIIIVGYVLE